MDERTNVVAVLVSNPALSSILTMVLVSVPSLRVRAFESQLALTTYMRLAPVDLIVSDFDCDTSPADRVARDLRANDMLESHDFQIIALATYVTPEMNDASITSGIDEIILKPMSPKYLLDRVLTRLRRGAIPVPAPVRLQDHPPHAPGPLILSYHNNVVPLFGRRFEPLH